MSKLVQFIKSCFASAGVGPKILLGLLLIGFPLWASGYLLSLMATALVFGIFAISIDLMWGYAGILNLGPAASFGLGAYILALGSKQFGLTATPLLLLFAVVVPALVAMGVGYPAFRSKTSMIYYALITMAVSILFEKMVMFWYGLTGGSNGVSNILLPLGSMTYYYYLVVLIALLVFFGALRVVRSPLGTVLRGIRANELKVETMGYDIAHYKLIVSMVAAGIGGIAGALFVPISTIAYPALFGVVLSIQGFIWVAVGGQGTLVGPFLAAVGIKFAEVFLSDISEVTYRLILGVIFIGVVLAFPGGVAGVFRRIQLSSRFQKPSLVPVKHVIAVPKSEVIAGEWMSPSSRCPLIETRNLLKYFGGLLVADSVNFTMYDGEIRCIVGPNGAGKTTFFNLLTGVIKPNGGTVLFQGRPITNLPSYRINRAGIARSFQTPQFFAHATVLENVRLAVQRSQETFNPFRSLESLPGVFQEAFVILKKVGLDDAALDIAGTLSHGEKKRLELGMCFASSPKLILLDEPTAGMTIQETKEVANLIRKFRGEASIIIIEHDINFVREIADRITVFHRGAILAEGTVEEIEKNQVVKEIYLGSTEN